MHDQKREGGSTRTKLGAGKASSAHTATAPQPPFFFFLFPLQLSSLSSFPPSVAQDINVGFKDSSLSLSPPFCFAFASLFFLKVHSSSPSTIGGSGYHTTPLSPPFCFAFASPSPSTFTFAWQKTHFLRQPFTILEIHSSSSSTSVVQGTKVGFKDRQTPLPPPFCLAFASLYLLLLLLLLPLHSIGNRLTFIPKLARSSCLHFQVAPALPP
ncbi:MAG: hypothetical protein J3Q66DRAFT_166205 [Benniella sp.]|nr:MAG: hypothetical protein J3Q66DRAFT_166205 [Benniella sp.]